MEHYNNPDCGCKKTTVEYKKCNKCKPDEPCECAVKDLSTNCIVYTDDDIQCNSTTIITKNLSLTENLKNLVAYICQRFTDLQAYFRIINVGTGAEIYSGDTLLGEKKLRTITSTDSSVIITENINTIDLSADIDQDNFVRQILVSENNLPENYDANDIIDYILSLPISERTIADKDSKWNIIVYRSTS